MRRIVAFYAWQSDTPAKINKDFIRRALDSATERINADRSLGVEIKIDSDTQGVPGTPPVTATILDKIAHCDLFIPDVTFVARTEGGKLVPNPSVMIEYGYAIRAKTDRAMMPIMNTAFGPPDELPFDMGHLRYPIQYRVETGMSDGQRRADRDALSHKIETHLREQIAATQPPSPTPAEFPKAEAKSGQARFRSRAEALGKEWSSTPFPRTPDRYISLSKGPAVWLRLFPTSDSGKRWASSELKTAVMPLGGGPLNLAPFSDDNHPFFIRAADGIGMCSYVAPAQTITNSVAFAFETGEVWSVDTALMTYFRPGILYGEIEKLYVDRLPKYGRYIASLGLAPPFHWIAGISGTKGRTLRIPVPGFSPGIKTGPECMAEDIVKEGDYDGQQSAAAALAPFFNEIYHACGLKRP